MRRPALLLAISALAACTGDETLSGYADPAAVYVLTEIDSAEAAGRATISFPDPGRIAGDAPCNLYSGGLRAPYPWFATGPIATTERACLWMEAEVAFFKALGAMTLAEVQGPVLILSNEAGREMVFRAQD